MKPQNKTKEKIALVAAALQRLHDTKGLGPFRLLDIVEEVRVLKYNTVYDILKIMRVQGSVDHYTGYSISLFFDTETSAPPNWMPSCFGCECPESSKGTRVCSKSPVFCCGDPEKCTSEPVSDKQADKSPNMLSRIKTFFKTLFTRSK